MTEDGRAAGLGVKALAAVFAVLTFALSIFRFLDGDEMEHVHSTWHVLNGAVPYVDFFEHHHPLLWYLLAPVLALTGESAHAIVLLRLGFFLLVLATARATYGLALECRASREAAWLSVFLLLSMTTFVYVAIEIRPDVPQTLFGVLSARYFVRMLRTRAARDAVLSGVFAAVAFLFLQKAVLLLALYPGAVRGLRRAPPVAVAPRAVCGGRVRGGVRPVCRCPPGDGLFRRLPRHELAAECPRRGGTRGGELSRPSSSCATSRATACSGCCRWPWVPRSSGAGSKPASCCPPGSASGWSRSSSC